MMKRVAVGPVTLAATLAALLATTSLASADVERTGTWPTPAEEKKVSLDLAHVSRHDALTKLAEAAGWNLVLRMDDVDGDKDRIDLHVKDESPSKILDIVLADGKWTAKRDGALVSVRSAETAAPAPAATAAEADAAPLEAPSAALKAAPLPSVRGSDRVVNGDDAVIEANEIVHDVSVVGGDLTVRGTVTGNAVVTGGTLKVVKGAHIVGNATAVGGELDVEDDAQIDGQVGVVGGVLNRGSKSVVGSAVTVGGDGEHKSGVLKQIGDALARSALLFVFGAVLFALAGQRMDTLRAEVAARPMRTFAMGIVGLIAGIVLVVALCVSVIGIPVAIVAVPAAVFAGYAGVCAVLATAGKALLGHRSDSPHVHLLVGCALFLVLGSLPWIGGIVTFAVVFLGIGTVVATRAAGLIRGKNGNTPSSGDPYRTIAT